MKKIIRNMFVAMVAMVFTGCTVLSPEVTVPLPNRVPLGNGAAVVVSGGGEYVFLSLCSTKAKRLEWCPTEFENGGIYDEYTLGSNIAGFAMSGIVPYDAITYNRAPDAVVFNYSDRALGKEIVVVTVKDNGKAYTGRYSRNRDVTWQEFVEEALGNFSKCIASNSTKCDGSIAPAGSTASTDNAATTALSAPIFIKGLTNGNSVFATLDMAALCQKATALVSGFGASCSEAKPADDSTQLPETYVLVELPVQGSTVHVSAFHKGAKKAEADVNLVDGDYDAFLKNAISKLQTAFVSESGSTTATTVPVPAATPTTENKPSAAPASPDLQGILKPEVVGADGTLANIGSAKIHDILDANALDKVTIEIGSSDRNGQKLPDGTVRVVLKQEGTEFVIVGCFDANDERIDTPKKLNGKRLFIFDGDKIIETIAKS
jgi:hypothetical protein